MLCVVRVLCTIPVIVDKNGCNKLIALQKNLPMINERWVFVKKRGVLLEGRLRVDVFFCLFFVCRSLGWPTECIEGTCFVNDGVYFQVGAGCSL